LKSPAAVTVKEPPMRRSRPLLSYAFSASLFVGGCLGSFGAPGEGPTTPQVSPHSGTSSGAGSSSGGSSSGSGSSNVGSGSSSGSGTGTGGGTGGGSGNGGGSSGGSGGSGGSAGSGGTMTGPPATSGALATTLSVQSDTLRLNETKAYTVTVTPSGGFNGLVTLALENPPAGVSAVFTPATFMAGGAPMTTQLELSVASDATAAPSLPVSIKASSGAITSSASLTLAVPAELLITIAKGVQIGSSAVKNTTAFSNTSEMTVKYVPGLKVTFVNNDIINHEIHAQNTANMEGIQHEQGPLMANAANSYTQTISGPGDIQANDIHCHLHPNMIGPLIHINK
jgi:plastocyanin